MKTISMISFLFLALSSQAQETPGQAPKEAIASAFADIQLFPNPTSEIIFIRYGELIDSYQVIDMQGRVVQTGLHNAQIISLVDVPVGYYFIELKIGEAINRVKVQKY